jgi:hypothetical protein
MPKPEPSTDCQVAEVASNPKRVTPQHPAGTVSPQSWHFGK